MSNGLHGRIVMANLIGVQRTLPFFQREEFYAFSSPEMSKLVLSPEDVGYSVLQPHVFVMQGRDSSDVYFPFVLWYTGEDEDGNGYKPVPLIPRIGRLSYHSMVVPDAKVLGRYEDMYEQDDSGLRGHILTSNIWKPDTRILVPSGPGITIDQFLWYQLLLIGRLYEYPYLPIAQSELSLDSGSEVLKKNMEIMEGMKNMEGKPWWEIPVPAD